MIDFHTHILPSIDDGSDSVEMSLELLESLKKQNVKLVFLTSHFYANKESVDEFLKRRQEAYEELDYKGEVELMLGAEVHYYRGISVNEEIEKLLLGKSNILLLELPFSSAINDNVIKEVRNLANRGFKVMLAHIERYNLSYEVIKEFKNNGILLQMNTEYINGFFSRNKALRLLKDGFIDALGSDCHNTGERKPEYLKAIEIIEKKLGKEFLDSFIDKTYKLI